jgi:hypothetical protein
MMTGPNEQHGGKRARIPSVQEVRVYVCTDGRRVWVCSCELSFVQYHVDDARPTQSSTRQYARSEVPVAGAASPLNDDRRSVCRTSLKH